MQSSITTNLCFRIFLVASLLSAVYGQEVYPEGPFPPNPAFLPPGAAAIPADYPLYPISEAELAQRALGLGGGFELGPFGKCATFCVSTFLTKDYLSISFLVLQEDSIVPKSIPFSPLVSLSQKIWEIFRIYLKVL